MKISVTSQWFRSLRIVRAVHAEYLLCFIIVVVLTIRIIIFISIMIFIIVVFAIIIIVTIIILHDTLNHLPVITTKFQR